MEVTVILGVYLMGSIALPLVWDYRHRQDGRPRRRTASTSGTMRQRGRA